MFSTPNFSDQKIKPFSSAYQKNTMYPKVKVKEQEEDDLLTINTRPPLKDFDFLLTYDFNSPVSEFEDDSPTSVVRIPDTYLTNLPHSSKREAKIRNKKKPTETITTPDTRAILPVPPPRAILSSPDNDVLVRSKNKGKIEPVPGSKDQNVRENRHVRCKAIPRRSIFETTKPSKRDPKETREVKLSFNEKTRAGVADTRQRTNERKPKPEWV